MAALDAEAMRLLLQQTLLRGPLMSCGRIVRPPLSILFVLADVHFLSRGIATLHFGVRPSSSPDCAHYLCRADCVLAD